MPLRRSCLHCDTKGPHCFCTLDRTALQRLDGLGTWHTFGAREPILHEGFPPDSVYVICRGMVKLTTSSSDGRLLLLRIVGPGDVLGLAAALRRSRYEATAEALETCQLKAVPRTQFLLFMQEFQAAGRNAAIAIARDYQKSVLSARRLAISTSATAKLAAALADWGELARAGQMEDQPVPVDVPNTVRFRMPLTHEELGHLAGISRETVTRIIGSMRRDALVQTDGEWMTVMDLRRLCECAC